MYISKLQIIYTIDVTNDLRRIEAIDIYHKIRYILFMYAPKLFPMLIPEAESVRGCCAEVIFGQKLSVDQISHKVYKKSI